MTKAWSPSLSLSAPELCQVLSLARLSRGLAHRIIEESLDEAFEGLADERLYRRFAR